MDVGTYEKSFDNRCAALVSRDGRAPRAGQNRKTCRVNGLRLISLLSMARGAQVSRAARGSNRGRDSTTEVSRYRLRCHFETFEDMGNEQWANVEQPPGLLVESHSQDGCATCHATSCAKCQKCCVLLHFVALRCMGGKLPSTSSGRAGQAHSTGSGQAALQRSCALETALAPP